MKFEARLKELVENLPDLAELVELLLVVRPRDEEGDRGAGAPPCRDHALHMG